MPNHVTHQFKVHGPAAEVDRFVDTCIRKDSEEGERMLDFKAIIPRPAILDSSESSSNNDFGVRLIQLRSNLLGGYDQLGVYGSPAWLKKFEEEGFELAAMRPSVFAEEYLKRNPDIEEAGRATMRCMAETGFPSWYEWSIANWGTKWGAYSFHEIDREPGFYHCQFATAWSPPAPIFDKLVEMFPELSFYVACFDEGWNFAGRGWFGASAFSGENPMFESFASPPELMNELYEEVYGEPPELDEEEEEMA